MHAPVLEIRPLHFYEEACRLPGGAGTSVVRDRGNRVVHYWPPSAAESEAPFHVLAIHEERLVQPSDLLDRQPTREPTAPAQNAHNSNVIMLPVGHVMRTERRRPRKERVQCQRPKQHRS